MNTSTDRSNLVILRATMTSDPIRRELASGTVVAQFDVTTPLAPTERPATVSVPVSWPDPPPAATRWLVTGEQLVIVGSVRRRFFRVGGATQSRTEVVAEVVMPARREKTARRAIDAAVGSVAPVSRGCG